MTSAWTTRWSRSATPARIAAVVDWEMSTLGDPLADLGLTLSYWADSEDRGYLDINVGATITALPGFCTRKQFAARYAELTGRDVSGIGYYIAFGFFKLAVVLEGINARFLQGKTVGEGFDREGPGGAGADRPGAPDAGYDGPGRRLAKLGA